MKREQVEQLPWQEVESSNVARVAWVQSGEVGPEAPRMPGEPLHGFPHLGHLYVEFRGSSDRIYRRIYRYRPVRKEAHAELLEAESVGGYLNAQIKPHHEVERIEIEEDDEP